MPRFPIPPLGTLVQVETAPFPVLPPHHPLQLQAVLRMDSGARLRFGEARGGLGAPPGPTRLCGGLIRLLLQAHNSPQLRQRLQHAASLVRSGSPTRHQDSGCGKQRSGRGLEQTPEALCQGGAPTFTVHRLGVQRALPILHCSYPSARARSWAPAPKASAPQFAGAAVPTPPPLPIAHGSTRRPTRPGSGSKPQGDRGGGRRPGRCRGGESRASAAAMSPTKGSKPASASLGPARGLG